jgi:hypothetical protein
MRNTLTMAAVALVAMAVGSALPMVTAAPPPHGPQAEGADLPHRTTRAFAPFIRAIVTRRTNQAEKMFNMRRSVLRSLEQDESVRILAKFPKPDQLELNLIGGRTLGRNIGLLLFTVATEEGPVAFKIYYSGYGETMTVGRMDITDDWDEVERLSLTVDSLPSPITVMLGQIDEGGGQ